jgi:hypothetical protein
VKSVGSLFYLQRTIDPKTAETVGIFHLSFAIYRRALATLPNEKRKMTNGKWKIENAQ